MFKKSSSSSSSSVKPTEKAVTTTNPASSSSKTSPSSTKSSAPPPATTVVGSTQPTPPPTPVKTSGKSTTTTTTTKNSNTTPIAKGGGGSTVAAAGNGGGGGKGGGVNVFESDRFKKSDAVAVVDEGKEEQEEEHNELEVAQNLYEGAKNVWAVGNNVPVLNLFLKATEAVVGTIVGVSTGKELTDVDRGIKPKLAELDYHIDGLVHHKFDTPPSLLEDVEDMIAASTLLYPASSLRVMARMGLSPQIALDKLQANNHGMLEHPISCNDMVEMMIEYGVIFGDPTFTAALVGMILTIFKGEHNGRLNKVNAEIMVISDEHPTELVYSIILDKVCKRIIVSFRGTHNIQDTLQDMNIETMSVPNPAKVRGGGGEMSSLPDNVIFHKGFHDYLFSKEFSASGILKYDEIMGHIMTLLDQHKGFQVYVTGYSLGASLATVFGFYASTNPAITKPLICMPVASPYVGDYNFLRTFQYQEKHNQIRMCRIANNKDIVTYVPTVTVRDLEVQEGSVVPLKHVGMCLTMYKSTKYLGLIPVPFSLPVVTKEVGDVIFTYPKDAVSTMDVIDPTDDLDTIDKMLLNHLGHEYFGRAELNKGHLRKMTLTDLYDDVDLVGDLFEEEEASGGGSYEESTPQ